MAISILNYSVMSHRQFVLFPCYLFFYYILLIVRKVQGFRYFGIFFFNFLVVLGLKNYDIG